MFSFFTRSRRTKTTLDRTEIRLGLGLGYIYHGSLRGTAAVVTTNAGATAEPPAKRPKKQGKELAQ